MIKAKTIVLIERLHWLIFKKPISGEMKNFITNLGWVSFGTIVAMILLFLANLFAARWLGPDEYGRFSLVTAFSQLLILPMLIGLEHASTRYLASEKNKDLLASTSLIGFLGYLGASTLLYFIFKPQILTALNLESALFGYAVIYAIVLAGQRLGEGLLKGFHEFKRLALVKILQSVLIFVVFFIAVGLFDDFSFRSYTIATIVGFFGYFAYSLFDLRNSFKLIKPTIPVLKKITTYGGIASIGGLAIFISLHANRFILNSYTGPAAVGLLAAYLSAANAITGQIRLVFSQVFFPTVSKIGDISEIISKLNRIALIAFVPLSLINSILIAGIIYLFGSQYDLQLGYTLLFGLNATLFFYSETYRWFNNSRGTGSVKKTVATTSLIAIISLVLNFVLIRSLGIYGAIIILVLVNGSQYLAFARQIRIQPKIRN